MAYFSGYQYSITGYIESKCEIADKIIACDALINLFMASMLDSFSSVSAGTQMYELDDGQVRIKTSFRSMTDIKTALFLLRTEKNKYINQYNGRTFVAQDKRNFR
jgi:hypothetical protein